MCQNVRSRKVKVKFYLYFALLRNVSVPISTNKMSKS